MQYSTYDNLENVTMAGNCIKGTQDPSMLLLDLHENLQLSQEEIFNLKIIISNIFINDVFLNVFLTTAYSYKHVLLRMIIYEWRVLMSTYLCTSTPAIRTLLVYRCSNGVTNLAFLINSYSFTEIIQCVLLKTLSLY